MKFLIILYHNLFSLQIRFEVFITEYVKSAVVWFRRLSGEPTAPIFFTFNPVNGGGQQVPPKCCTKLTHCYNPEDFKLSSFTVWQWVTENFVLYMVLT
jgi:hypothetical protein